MRTTLTYALVITPFETNFINDLQNWDEVAEQDFTTHALYCNNTKQFLLLSNNIKIDVDKNLLNILKIIHKIGVKTKINKKILVVEGVEQTESALSKYLD